VARIVVVGAGMGGLAVAARLAVSRHHVVVCEQADTVGGKLGEYEREGFRFDTGPSLLTLPAVYRDLFRATGRPLEDVLDVVPVEFAARYRFADGTVLDLPNTGVYDVCAALEEALGGGAGAQWQRLMDRGSAIWDATRDSVLGCALTGPWDLVRRLRRVSDLRAVAPWRTMRGLGDTYLTDPRLRMLLDRYATYVGSDPRRAPAALATIPYVEQTFGSWYIRGGLRRLADALADRVRELDAVIRIGADVRSVDLSGGRVRGVTLASGERLAADVVVSDADAAHLYGDLVRAPAALRRLRRATPSLAGFVLLLGIRGPARGLAHHTVLFPADYDAEFDSIFGRVPRPVADPAIYLAVADDPLVAPADCSAWFVLVNAPRQGPVDWTAPGVAAGYAQRLLGLLAARGYDVRDRIACWEWRTPADYERDTRAPGGAIYGTSSNGLRAAFLRPANASPVPGVYLVGGSAHPGGGLPLVGMSAEIVSRLIGPA
jgi:phytoene desaturase